MPIDVGAQAPDFTLKDQNNQEVRLADFRGRKAVLLVFYPLAFTGTCQGELAGVRDNLADFANDAVQVLTVSVDSAYSHKVWADREGFDFPLLADFWPHGGGGPGVRGLQRGGAASPTGARSSSTPTGVVRFAEMTGPGEARDQTGWRVGAERRCPA